VLPVVPQLNLRGLLLREGRMEGRAREGRREGRVGERSEGKGGKERERREEKGEGRCERLHHGCWGMNASELHCLNLNINFTLPR